MKVKCPNCGKQAEYSDLNPYRPFCCEKCRYIDFGDWIEEKNRIPDEEASFSPEPASHMNENRH